MLQDRLKMLVFDRLGFSPLPWYFCSSVHYIAFPVHLIQMHIYLECLGVSLAEYVRYSHLPFCFFCFPYILSCCDQTLESRSRRSPMEPTTTSRSPMTRSSSEVPGQEACAFSIELLLFVLAFLRQIMCTCVCTQILLLPLTCVSRAVVFEPSWPLVCNIKLVLFYY